MPRPNAFKANASFFRMIALGAVGAQVVQDHLAKLGHQMVEIERGSLSTKIWKDVKRKRVRIPDLCCTSCGVRVESRAKTKPDLRMSHSTQDAERAWDYGMVGGDWIAFPVLTSEEDYWSRGGLEAERSHWRERILTSWRAEGYLNLFSVESFRGAAFEQIGRKGVTEGSEVQIKWSARFAPAEGYVARLDGERVFYATLDAPERERHYRLGSYELLKLVLEDQAQPLYLRSACAWSIGCHRAPEAAECLVGAFADIDLEVRNEALAAFENLAESGLQALVAGLGHSSSEIAAGSAEAIRRIGRLPSDSVETIVDLAESSKSTWPAWALGHLPLEDVKPFVATLQDRRPDVHFALSVLWTFLESWVSRDWAAR